MHSIQLYLNQTGVTKYVPDPANSTKKIKVNVGDSPRSLQRPAPATITTASLKEFIAAHRQAKIVVPSAMHPTDSVELMMMNVIIAKDPGIRDQYELRSIASPPMDTASSIAIVRSILSTRQRYEQIDDLNGGGHLANLAKAKAKAESEGTEAKLTALAAEVERLKKKGGKPDPKKNSNSRGRDSDKEKPEKQKPVKAPAAFEWTKAPRDKDGRVTDFIKGARARRQRQGALRTRSWATPPPRLPGLQGLGPERQVLRSRLRVHRRPPPGARRLLQQRREARVLDGEFMTGTSKCSIMYSRLKRLLHRGHHHGARGETNGSPRRAPERALLNGPALPARFAALADLLRLVLTLSAIVLPAHSAAASSAAAAGSAAIAGHLPRGPPRFQEHFFRPTQPCNSYYIDHPVFLERARPESLSSPVARRDWVHAAVAALSWLCSALCAAVIFLTVYITAHLASWTVLMVLLAAAWCLLPCTRGSTCRRLGQGGDFATDASETALIGSYAVTLAFNALIAFSVYSVPAGALFLVAHRTRFGNWLPLLVAARVATGPLHGAAAASARLARRLATEAVYSHLYSSSTSVDTAACATRLRTPYLGQWRPEPRAQSAKVFGKLPQKPAGALAKLAAISGVIDSGCTAHVTHNPEWLVNTRLCKGTYSAAAGDRASAAVIGDMPVVARVTPSRSRTSAASRASSTRCSRLRCCGKSSASTHGSTTPRRCACPTASSSTSATSGCRRSR